MTDIARLGLEADSSQIKAASRDLDALSKSAKSTESATERMTREYGLAAKGAGGVTSATQRMTQENLRAANSMDGLLSRGGAVMQMLGRMAAAIGAAFSINQLRVYADTWSDLTSRIQVSIGQQGNAAAVMDRLSKIARITYSNLEATADSFARNSFTLKALGKSTEEQLNFTEALNNALVVSGAKGHAFELVQNSLSRAMAEGTMRGQELDIVLNYGSRVAQLLADQLGVNVTQLRAMAKEGRITGEVIYKSLIGNFEALRADAESMPATIGDAFIIIRNSILQTVGVFDQQKKLSEGLATSIIKLADNMSTLAPIVGSIVVGALVGMSRQLVVTAAQATVTAASMTMLGLASRVMAGNFTAAAVAAGVLRTAIAFIAGPIGIAVAAATGLYLWLKNSREEAERFGAERSAVKTIQDLVAEAEKLRSGGSLIPKEDLKVIEDTHEEIRRLAKSMGDLTVMRDNFATSGMYREAADLQGEIDKVGKRIGNLSEYIRRYNDLASGAASATEDQSRSISKQIGVLEKQLALMRAGTEEREAALRVQLAADGATKDEINQYIRLQREIAGIAKARTEATKAHEEAIAAEIEHNKLQEAYRDRVTEQGEVNVALRETLALVLAGAEAEAAAYEVDQKRLLAKGDALSIALAQARATQRLIDQQSELSRASQAAALEVQRDWKRQTEEINRSLTDALLRGFEAGKGFAQNFIDTLKNLFQTLVLRPVIEFAVAPLTGLIQSVVGGIGTSLGGSLLGMVPGLAGAGLGGAGLLGGLASGAWAGFGGAGFAAGPPTAAQAMGFGFGSSAIGAGLIGGGLGYLGGSLLASRSSRFNENTGSYAAAGGALGAAAGSVIPGLGTIVGGLLGSAVGSVIGGIQGKWKTKSQELGISLVDDLIDATITTRRQKKNILGSSKGRTLIDDASELDDMLSDVFGGIFGDAKKAAEALGVSVDGFTYRATTSIKGLKGAELEAAITGLIEGASEALAEKIIPNFRDYQREGESAAQTLMRVTGETVALRQIMGSLGGDVGALSRTLGVDLAQEIAAVAGGFDVLAGNLNTFYQSFYSETERQARATQLLVEEMTRVGYVLPTTRSGFRDLVTGLDLTTESGREAYAALLALSGEANAYYSSIERAAQEAAEAREREVAAARELAELARRRADYDRDIANQIAALGLDGLDLDLFNARTDFLDRMREARELGASVNQIEALYQAQRLKIIRGYEEQARDAIRAAYERQARDLQQTIDKFASFSSALSKFRQELDYGPAALLTPMQQYEALRKQFDDTRALAAVGDETALAALEQVSRQFLTASQAVNASGEAYFRDLEAVRAAVDLGRAAADAEMDIGQRQLNALTLQVERLVQIDQSVQSVEDAINALSAIQAQAARFTTSSLGQTPAVPLDRSYQPAPADRASARGDEATRQLSAVVAQLQQQVANMSVPVTVQTVSPDGRVLAEQTVDLMRERSRRGELVIFEQGVGRNASRIR